jgi:hypothetical protein
VLLIECRGAPAQFPTPLIWHLPVGTTCFTRQCARWATSGPMGIMWQLCAACMHGCGIGAHPGTCACVGASGHAGLWFMPLICCGWWCGRRG